MNHLHPFVAREVLECEPAIGKYLVVEPVEPSVGSCRPDLVGHCLSKRLETCLALHQRLLGSFQLADVERDAINLAWLAIQVPPQPAADQHPP